MIRALSRPPAAPAFRGARFGAGGAFLAVDFGSAKTVRGAMFRHLLDAGAAPTLEGGPVPQSYAVQGSAANPLVTVAANAAHANIFGGASAGGPDIRFKAPSGAGTYMLAGKTTAGSVTRWLVYLENLSGGFFKARFIRDFSTTDGQWVTTDRVVKADAYNRLQISYRDTDTANDPTFTLTVEDGSPQVLTVGSGLTEVVAPAGSAVSDASEALYLFNRPALDLDFDGIINGVSLEKAGAEVVNFPMTEGTGTTITDSVAGLTGAFSGTLTWTAEVWSPVSEAVANTAEAAGLTVASPAAQRYARLRFESLAAGDRLGEVVLLDRALRAGELELYQCSGARPFWHGALAHFRFLEPAGLSCLDHSGRGAAGALSAGARRSHFPL